MKIYKATGNGVLSVETMDAPQNPALVKIKISHLMPTAYDASLFKGAVKTAYPHSLGSVAIGVISDDRPEYGLKRGTKVILNPYEVESCDRLDIAGRVKTRGAELDGLFCDFAYLGVDDITPFPEEVHEDEAIFAVKIAVAMQTINAFRVEKGDYMVILGGNAICNIIAQLAMYFQMIPIVVDSNEDNLRKMEENGIYYTINSTREAPYDKVMELTGGRMAEHTVLDANGSATPNFLFTLAREGGDCTILCENKWCRKLESDLEAVSRKQLKVKGISHGAQEMSSAVNILAQNILNFQSLIDKRYSLEEAETAFKETDTSLGSLCSVINLL